jgi:hypothetical protein
LAVDTLCGDGQFLTVTNLNFKDFLRMVGKKPAFYLSPYRGGNCKSIRHLKTFLNGVQVGQRRQLQDDEGVLDAFSIWVCLRYQESEGARDGLSHILEHAGGDEEVAFNMFFGLLEEYFEERERLGHDEIMARYLAMEQRASPENKAPTIEEIRNDGFFQPYVNTLKRVFSEILGWPESRTIEYVEQELQHHWFRSYFGHDTPCDVAASVIVECTLRDRLIAKRVSTVDVTKEIVFALQGSADTYKMHPDTDPHFNWQLARDKISDIIKECERMLDEKA